MENIQVVLCGTDAFQVETVLQGIVEKEHYAWNKKYRFSCTNALSIDRIDSRLLLLCHAIVLCKGCRSPKEKAAYGGRPVLSLPDATAACVEEVQDSEIYYGSVALEDLRTRVVAVALTPPHVVYDALLQCLTPLGEAAYRRAFWLLDRNNDRSLDREELLAWARLTRASAFTERDLTEFLAAAAEVIGPVPDLSLTEAQFTQLHVHWLESGNNEDAWATLHSVGTHPDSLPYSWYDLHSMRVDRDVNTYLSPHAIQFFRNVFKLKNFKTAPSESGGIWAVTPGCPWEHVNGFSTAPVIPLDRFIEYWKYMALERRDVVIMYARYWGYKGDATFLFVQRNARVSRDLAETLPNTLQVLVVGSLGCGRKTLIFELTTDGKERREVRDGTALYVRTTTFFAEKAGGSGGTMEEPQTIAYTTISPDKAELVLTNESLNKTFDVVLLCVDGSDYANSATYAMSLYQRARDGSACQRMPFLLVLTKSDSMADDEMPSADTPMPFATPLSVPTATSTTSTLAAFARNNRLLWPPIVTSALRPEESEIAVINEYMYSVARCPDLAVGKAPVTWVKLLRRATFVAIVAIGTGGLLQKAGQWLLSRRKK